MDEITSAEVSRPVMLVFDRLKLRRAAFASFLKSWAEQMGLATAEAQPVASAADSLPGAECRIAVFAIGGSTVNGPEARDSIEHIRALLPDAPLVILSDREDPEEVVGAFRAGARGFVPTSTNPSVALQTLTFILSGGSFFPPTALLHPTRRSDGAGAAASRSDKGHGESSAPMTPKQQAVLNLLCQGKSNKVIARELGMQESTVKVHVRQIMRKLGASNRTQVVLYTMEAPPPSGGRDGTLPPQSEKPAPILRLSVPA